MRVEQGMTLYSISRANGLTVAQLAAANDIDPPYTVSTGRVLRIPGVAQARAPKPSFAPQGKKNSLPMSRSRRLPAAGTP